MKHSIKFFIASVTTIFINAFPGVIKAQPATFENAIQPHYYSSFSHIFAAPQGSWIAAGNYRALSWFFTYGYIESYDSTGNTTWNITFLDTGETVEITDMIETIDQQYLVTGRQNYCDIGGMIYFLKKFDASGNVTWTKFHVPDSYLWGDPVACQLNSGTYILGIDTVLHFSNVSGDSLTDIPFNNGTIFCLTETKNNTIAAGSQSGLTILDTSGSQLNFFPFPSGVSRIVQREDSVFLALSGQQIYMLDQSFTLIDSVDLSNDLLSIHTMKYSLGKLWLMGKNANPPGSEVIAMDSAGMLSSIMVLPDSDLTTFDLAIDSLHVAVAGKEITLENHHMYIGTYLLNGTHDNFEKDAGIISVRYDTVYAIHINGSPPSNNQIFFDTYVTLMNFGRDTLQDVYINAKLDAIYPCGHNYYMSQFSGLQLPPGKYVEIPLGLGGDVRWCYGLCTFTYCFWTSSPDGRTDFNHANDSACGTFMLDIFDDVQEVSPEQTGWIVSPNPFNTSLNLHFNSAYNGSGRLFIFDSMGKKFLEKEIILNDQSLEVSDLAKGLYLIRIETPDRIFQKKIIKE